MNLIESSNLIQSEDNLFPPLYLYHPDIKLYSIYDSYFYGIISNLTMYSIILSLIIQVTFIPF